MNYSKIDSVDRLSQSFCDELSSLKCYMVEFQPELEKILDIDGIQALDMGYGAAEWPLQEGKTVGDVINVIRKNIRQEDYLYGITCLARMNDEGYFTIQDGKVISSGLILEFPPIGFIKHLLNADRLTLFECLFLVGHLTDAEEILSRSCEIVSKALSSGDIEPRHPELILKERDLPNVSFDGEFNIPNLSWVLTFEEANKWVSEKFSFNLIDSRDEINNTEADETINIPEPEISEKKEKKLLSIIGLLAETLANTNPGDFRNNDGNIILGNGEISKEGKENLLSEINSTLDKLVENNEIENSYGLGKSTLQEVIKDGIQALKNR